MCMYKKSDIKFGECVYCGIYKTIDYDHIPPINIFSKPRPSNLIKVPSCHNCNGGSSKDDEYFWITLSIREDVINHPVVYQNRTIIDRAMNNPNKVELRKSFDNSIKISEAFSKCGIFIGEKHFLDVKLERLNRVAERIIKGLYYHHTNSILGKGFKSVAYITDCVNTQSWENIKKLYESLRFEKSYRIGNNVFEYKYKVTYDNNKVSLWILKFYDKIHFFGATISS